jgi:glycosyltransferase involved in cell wall biosynthesis
MISAYNVMDFGVPGIQMIADLSFDDGLRRELDFTGGVAEGALHRASAGRSLYLGLARALAGDRRDGWMRNRTVANSQWTAGLLRDRLGLASEVVYPPVAGDFPLVPWDEREDGFVVMGRLVPEKGIAMLVAVLAEIRKERSIHLHIIGRRGPAGTAREIEELCRRHAEWVHLEGEMYGPEKERFLAGHKYGISGRRSEAFGIAVAEMVKAGCLVWVPDGGGQTEIVAHPELIYAGREEAAAKIRSVLTEPGNEARLRDHLRVRAGLFSAERFVREMRTIFAKFLEENRAGAS